jgi:DNA replication protein DnaC
MSQDLQTMLEAMRKPETRPASCDKHGPFESRKLFGAAWSRCSKCAEEAQAEERRKQAEQMAENNRRAWEAKIGRAGIPERFRDRELSAYVATTEGQQRALKFAQTYADKFNEVIETGKSALFIGKPGTGKTHLAIGIALHVMREHKRSALFITVMRAIRSIKDTWRKDSELSEAEAIEDLVFPDLLILDEVGIQFGSDAEKLLLFDVLNERYERRKPTLMLSNLTAPEVAAYLGERVMDRLREDGGQAIVFDWQSHRGARQ